MAEIDYTTSGTVTKPVVLTAVAKLLGISTNDLGTLCSSTKISNWSKYKPFRYSALFFEQDTDSSKTDRDEALANSNTGGGGIPSECRYDNLASLVSATKPNLWTYFANLPRGGSDEPFRLADFINYNHKAKYLSCVGLKYYLDMDTSKTLVLGEIDTLSSSNTSKDAVWTIDKGQDKGVELCYPTLDAIDNCLKWYQQKEIYQDWYFVIAISNKSAFNAGTYWVMARKMVKSSTDASVSEDLPLSPPWNRTGVPAPIIDKTSVANTDIDITDESTFYYQCFIGNNDAFNGDALVFTKPYYTDYSSRNHGIFPPPLYNEVTSKMPSALTDWARRLWGGTITMNYLNTGNCKWISSPNNVIDQEAPLFDDKQSFAAYDADALDNPETWVMENLDEKSQQLMRFGFACVISNPDSSTRTYSKFRVAVSQYCDYETETWYEASKEDSVKDYVTGVKWCTIVNGKVNYSSETTLYNADNTGEGVVQPDKKKLYVYANSSKLFEFDCGCILTGEHWCTEYPELDTGKGTASTPSSLQWAKILTVPEGETIEKTITFRIYADVATSTATLEQQKIAEITVKLEWSN